MCQIGPVSQKNAVATRLIRRGVIFGDDKFTAETHGEKNRKSPNSWRICWQENTARLWTSIVAEFSEFVEL